MVIFMVNKSTIATCEAPRSFVIDATEVGARSRIASAGKPQWEFPKPLGGGIVIVFRYPFNFTAGN